MKSKPLATFGKWIVGVIALAACGLATAADDSKVDLKVGDVAPTFEGVDEQGFAWKSADRVGKKVVVVYFYPGDFTPGCIRQAQAFRDGMNALTAKGVEVVGISGDSARSHSLFKKAQKLNFTLLADEDGALAKKFGVPVGKGGQVKVKDEQGNPITLKRAVTAARWTFIIGKDGKILYKNTKVNPAQDSKQVTQFIEKLPKK
jgi:peroxiredoxin Q/BCP